MQGNRSRPKKTEFQSSPGPKAERCRQRRRGAAGNHRFNPRPARRPSAAVLQVDVAHAALHVSILARPEGRALHPRHLRQRRRSRRFNPRPARRPSAAHTRRSDGNTRGEVSILARPEGRALPSPGPKADSWRRSVRISSTSVTVRCRSAALKRTSMPPPLRVRIDRPAWHAGLPATSSRLRIQTTCFHDNSLSPARVVSSVPGC